MVVETWEKFTAVEINPKNKLLNRDWFKIPYILVMVFISATMYCKYFQNILFCCHSKPYMINYIHFNLTGDFLCLCAYKTDIKWEFTCSSYCFFSFPQLRDWNAFFMVEWLWGQGISNLSQYAYIRMRKWRQRGGAMHNNRVIFDRLILWLRDGLKKDKW